MADDDKTSDPGGFDDWLEETPGPPTDPYASLKDDDPEEEIADWVAFTEGRDGSGDDETPAALPVSDLTELPTQEMDPSDLPGADRSGDGADEPTDLDDDETSEIDLSSPAEESTEESVLAFDADDQTEEPDSSLHDTPPGSDADDDADDDDVDDVDDQEDEVITDELPPVPSPADDADQELEDTGELDIVPIAPYGGFSQGPTESAFVDEQDDESDPASAGPADTSSAGEAIGVAAAATSQRPELFDITEDDYLGTATREHTDLAEAIALAEEEDTERVAVVAPIPGLADTVVGFEDVVEAEGMRKARSRRSGDLVARVITAVVLIAALGASLVWQPALVALAVAVFVIGAGEFYTSLVRSDRKPIALFGFIGIIGASLGAYFWGAIAIPSGFFIAATLLLLFYAVVPGKRDPMGNLALTITVMVWAGLGAFAMPIIASESYRPLVMGVVVAVAAMDIAQYFFGRMLGRTQLAPWVSPKKTVEGLVAGVIVALAIGAALSFVAPFELTSGMLLGVIVAILAPIGDLAMSAAKRSLGLKDMGSVLPGHGGFLDRIDGLLFVIPAAWAAFLWAGLL
jgi:phosphatidate cytidylyltransferase